ncbi:MAG: DJ-1/PfpI family protein [Candidatus Heimdallarchaeota archaeon]
MKASRKHSLVYINLVLVLVVVFANMHQVSTSKSTQWNSINTRTDISNDEVDILILSDDTYGGNLDRIITKFTQFGWNITLAGPTPSIEACSFLPGQTNDVDILISEVGDVTQYDCISIMPGPSHDYLRTNSIAQNLIKSAVSNGLVVSAWCRAVRVLAEADVIDGKNVTGYLGYQSYYESAGATFFEGSAPIIDGNIVTCVRSNFYQTAMCLAIAEALGVLETNAPTIGSLSVSLISENSYKITVVPTDESGMFSVKATLNPVFIPEDSYASKITLTLEKQDSGIFNKTITNLLPVIYSIDLELADIFFNSKTYTNETLLDNLNTGTTSLFLPIISLVIIVNLYILFKKRRT